MLSLHVWPAHLSQKGTTVLDWSVEEIRGDFSV